MVTDASPWCQGVWRARGVTVARVEVTTDEHRCGIDPCSPALQRNADPHPAMDRPLPKHPIAPRFPENIRLSSNLANPLTTSQHQTPEAHATVTHRQTTVTASRRVPLPSPLFHF